MSNIVVEVNHVWKRFHRGEFNDSLRDAIPAMFRRLTGRHTKSTELGKGDFWALKDISFQVKRGETLGIVGHNGSGKSTLLKILSNILKANRGSIQVNGRLRALIEVAAGFHGDLTGRENIFLNGSILGMTQKEIAAKYDEIVEFSGIGEFLDTPVKRYSSGMYARLGFSVAAHLEPEILIVDEVLSVGDAAFQKKCLGKMNQVAGEGRTVLFVSHNMAAVKSLCQRSILLDHGNLVAEGPTDEVLNQYMGSAIIDESIPLSQQTNRQGNGQLRIQQFSAESNGEPNSGFLSVGQQLSMHFDYRCYETLINPAVFLSIVNADDDPVFHINTQIQEKLPPKITKDGTFTFHIPHLPLTPGHYTVRFAITDMDGQHVDRIANIWSFEVLPGRFLEMQIPKHQPGAFVADFSWEITDQS
ncbi:MAG: ABC transporter ATP-binding protein [Planctomycetia bacterium]|nr:ABC transporter ATP-binding protein [Planctomycetia bacterium]